MFLLRPGNLSIQQTGKFTGNLQLNNLLLIITEYICRVVLNIKTYLYAKIHYLHQASGSQ
jgi:hypothetical protein